MGARPRKRGVAPGRAMWRHACQADRDIAFFVRVRSAVAGGVRRIETVTEAAHLNGLAAVRRRLWATDLLKVAPEQLAERVAGLVEDNRKAERDISTLRRKLAAGGSGGDAPTVVNGVNFVGRLLEDTPARELKSMADEIKANMQNAVICLVGQMAARRRSVALTADLAASRNAVDLVKVGSAAMAAAAVAAGRTWRRPAARTPARPARPSRLFRPRSEPAIQIKPFAINS